MAKAKWFLLFRWEEGYKVWSYQPLRKGGLQQKRKEGWRIERGA